jgi:ubiquitin conjugation factor E4 B
MLSNGAMLQERLKDGTGLELDADSLDGVLVARLIEEPPAGYPLAPVPYLLGCYQRARELPASAAGGAAIAAALKDAVVSYLWLALNQEGIVPQPAVLEARGTGQLFDALWQAVPHSSSAQPAQGAQVPLPPGVLDHSLRTKPEETRSFIQMALLELRNRALRTSILGDFNALDCCWFRLLESKDLAAAVAESLSKTRATNGHDFELDSPLAALMAISYLPAPPGTPEPQPPVMAEVWLPMADHPAQAQAAVAALSSQHVQALQQLFSSKWLLCAAARPATLAWVATALNVDAERAKTVMRREAATSNGFMHNLTRVLLHLCGPFLDFYSGKAVQLIDARRAPTLATSPCCA